MKPDKYFLRLGLLVIGCIGARYAAGAAWAATAAPTPAAQVGYLAHTFSSDPFTASVIDIGNSKQSGFSWYMWDLFGYKSDPAAVQIENNGNVALRGDSTGAAGEIVTATMDRATNSFVGTAFGGGAYVEATLKFDSSKVINGPRTGWPSFWALPVEGSYLANANQWKGQPPGYQHQLEADFMEFPQSRGGMTANDYAGSMHEWYGIYNQSCGHGLCQVGYPFHSGLKPTPVGTDFSQFHTYGFLWVPATATTKGYAEFFFDGAPIGDIIQWSLFDNQPPPPTNQDWAFGILDRQHMFLILSTGLDQGVVVKSVDVWQKSAAMNLTH